ncbi:MAG TPA: 16S rRNA (adenine(1518)-N(6)/adenine(1519)-N(6))-dimethyltransferase RsmA, partial [Clostridia bacterium]|nr:16S rRNA (adenine(1518)-N(6)/adenine(1519)-N(6))-dimethyltransferase RsmA [Clostridia bacterium]
MGTTETKQLLNEFGLTPNKALGQNFLCDDSAISSILDAAHIDETCVLEIGPGLGALTVPLAKRAKKLAAVEIDASMYRVLETRLSGAGNVLLIHRDFLKLDLNALYADFFKGENFCVVANLPYYATTPICMALLSGGYPIKSMTLMLQKEAAERFFTPPETKIYGPLTVLAQYGYTVERELSLSPAAYYPAPEVDSVVIRLKKKADMPFLKALPPLLQTAFAMRRKTVFNNLKPLFESREELLSVLDACGIEPAVRAEALKPEAFARLALVLKDIKA